MQHTKDNRYDKDFFAWTLYQSDLLRKHKIEELDFENIAEEIEDLGKKFKRELRNRIRVLMKYLLKMEFQEEFRCHPWLLTIRTQRNEILYLLEENPSLKPFIEEYWKDCYEYAVKEAELEIDPYSIKFPMDCPWTQEEVLENLHKI